MDLGGKYEGEARFAQYIANLASVIGHADRVNPLRDYCVGLMMPCERKSVEPMAAITAPERTAAQHQSLLHFVGQAPWSDEEVLTKVRSLVLPEMERYGPIEAWIITILAFRRRDGTRWAWPDNIVGSSASKTIAKPRYRCRSPIAMPACR
jgi:SRSO17 transposase